MWGRRKLRWEQLHNLRWKVGAKATIPLQDDDVHDRDHARRLKEGAEGDHARGHGLGRPLVAAAAAAAAAAREDGGRASRDRHREAAAGGVVVVVVVVVVVTLAVAAGAGVQAEGAEGAQQVQLCVFLQMSTNNSDES